MERRVPIIAENRPVPFDRRICLERKPLVSTAYQVALIRPKGSGNPAYQVIDEVKLHQYRPYALGGSKLDFVAPYASSFLATAWLTAKTRRSGRSAVIQAFDSRDLTVDGSALGG